MLTEQRYQVILELLEKQKSITVTEVKELLEASESTVRRDITALHKAGKLTKVFGGAIALKQQSKVSAAEPTVAQKIEVNKGEKQKIAAYGVMSTPALVIDGKVVSYGKVLKKDEVVKLLKDVIG